MDAISVLQQSKTPDSIVRRIKWNEAENSYITVENYRHNKRTVCNIPAPQFLDGWFGFGHGYARSSPYTITLDINEELPWHYHLDYFERHPYFDLWMELSGGNLVITYDSAWYSDNGWKDDGCAGIFLIYG